jgi:putative endonuclease
VGEDVAVAWLTGAGFRMVERNHRNHAGEIDVVAWEGETLCFIEVKARASLRHGPAAGAVSFVKRRRIGRAAALFLAQRGIEPACRFDVLSLERGEQGWQVTLLRDAFQLG